MLSHLIYTTNARHLGALLDLCQNFIFILNRSHRSLFPSILPQAEARAEFAERSVQKLQKEVDRLEGE